MSEGLPEDKYKEFNQLMEGGFELQKQDSEDPERGPVVREMHAIVEAIYKNHRDNIPPYEDLSSFQHAFLEHFGRAEAQRYRLYHLIIGSSPPGDSDLFDADGEWSIAEAMRKLVEKYHISTEKI